MVLIKKENTVITLLKWHYAQIQLQRFGCNCYILQYTFIYNHERQTNNNVSCYDERIKKKSKHKKTPHSFYFLMVNCFRIHLLIYRFVETIFKLKPNTLIIKYTDTLTFNFANIIYPQRYIKS